MCDISASESSFLDESVCAGLGDAFVRSDCGKEQTSRAQPRPKQTRTNFLPPDDFSKFIEIPLCSNDSLRFRGRYFTSIAGPTQDPVSRDRKVQPIGYPGSPLQQCLTGVSPPPEISAALPAPVAGARRRA